MLWLGCKNRFQLKRKSKTTRHRSFARVDKRSPSVQVVSLHPETEQALMIAARDSEQSGGVVLDPAFAQDFLGRLEAVLRTAYASGHPPVLLVPTPIRSFVKRLVEPTYPNLAVMGYTEVTSSATVQSAGTVVTHGFAQANQAVS